MLLIGHSVINQPQLEPDVHALFSPDVAYHLTEYYRFLLALLPAAKPLREVYCNGTMASYVTLVLFR